MSLGSTLNIYILIRYGDSRLRNGNKGNLYLAFNNKKKIGINANKSLNWKDQLYDPLDVVIVFPIITETVTGKLPVNKVGGYYTRYNVLVVSYHNVNVYEVLSVVVVPYHLHLLIIIITDRLLYYYYCYIGRESY